MERLCYLDSVMRGWIRNRALAGAFVLGLTAAALVSGCGSSGPSTSGLETIGSTGSTTTPALSHSSYIRQADEICAESDAAITAITPGSTSAEQAASTTQQLQITRDELKSLQTLGAPEGDAPDAFLGDLDKVATQLSRKKLALERDDQSALPGIIAGIDTAQAKAQTSAQAYGFKTCGSFGNPSGTLPAPTGGGGGGGTATTPTTTTVVPTPTTPTTTTPPAPAPVPGGTGAGGTGGTTTSSGGSGSGGIGIG
jgi:hypothetical protein